MLKKEFLTRVGQYVTNHFDHGIEVIGRETDVEAFESAARTLSDKLKLPLEVRDMANPLVEW
jgi:hypothetical protein